jgi:BlaI family transcriptional regulator, penicillinase repressor
MMKRKRPPNPTEVELTILRVLWSQGPSTVREVHNTLVEDRPTGYSTTLKMLQVMHEKGLVLRDESTRPQVYRAALSQAATQKRLVDDLVQKAFGGAAGKLLVQALSSKRVSPEELAEIKQLIQELEKEQS